MQTSTAPATFSLSRSGPQPSSSSRNPWVAAPLPYSAGKSSPFLKSCTQTTYDPAPSAPSLLLALLGSFHFFTTGHQAVLSSIQWDVAFIPLSTIRYPWTPILIVLNSFGAQILTALAVPATVLWKMPPSSRVCWATLRAPRPRTCSSMPRSRSLPACGRATCAGT